MREDKPVGYRPTEARYVGPTKIYYLIYDIDWTYRGGIVHERTMAQRVYISGEDPEWDLEVKPRKNRFGRTVPSAIAVTYINVVSEAEATRRDTGTTYTLPEREMRVTKIIEVPKGARNLRVTDDRAEAEPYLMGVA